MDIIKPYVSDLLFEIGVEEMPSAPLNAAHAQLEKLAQVALADIRLDYKELQVYSTPRRLSLLVKGLADSQEDIQVEYKGPSKQIAYDSDGEPTQALQGFARGKGLDLSDIEVRETDGGQYVYAVKNEKGQAAKDLLPDLLAGLIAKLDWPKKQRWGSSDVHFIRPVRWILAILGSQTINVSFGDVRSSNWTYGHRFLSTQQIPIQAMREYKNVLRGNKVIVDHDKRREMILSSIDELAAPHGKALVPDKVLDEVVNLVEFPSALLCSFDREFLRVPREILEYAMNSHQRYFAIQTHDGSLDNHFVVISNGDPACAQKIAYGHESVIRARLADAAFFYDEDLKIGLDGWCDRLDSLLFQQKLGSLADKTARIVQIVEYLNEVLDVPDDVAHTALRAAELAKADLASSTVVEFTELQGTVGAHYASCQGESTEIARAIEEHYRPRYSGDSLPATLPAQLVSLADKVDTITGIIAAGKRPKGSSDPFALRRNVIGVLRIVMDALPADADLDIAGLIARSISVLPEDLQTDDAAQSVLDFFTPRIDTILRDAGYSTEVVSAVLANSATRPADACKRCIALQDFLEQGDVWENLSTAYTRAKNLSDSEAGISVNVTLFEQHEQAFYDVLAVIEPRVQDYLTQQAYREYLDELASMREPLDDFFDKVMIMVDDPDLRRNRLALLNMFIALVEPFADFRRLSK
ncbi:MAG: glycine--tRNA ligase subunit beta [Coriobacteriia bacterium]|nr:glycine--tRNA ligase subunit beta [Coriobacteriia bacterium]